jgi:uncharacterized membrane protein
MVTNEQSRSQSQSPFTAHGDLLSQTARGSLAARHSTLSGKHVNVGDQERIISLAAGSILALLGVRRRDLSGLLIAAVGGGLVWRGATGHSMVYDVLDVDTANSHAKHQLMAERGAHVTQSLIVDKPAPELYAYWRNFENLPRIMSHLESVQVLEDGRSRWVARPPGVSFGRVEWDAEITDEQPNQRIAWRSLPNSDVVHQGSVKFVPAPGDRGTVVHVVMDYLPPAGPIGQLVKKLLSKALSRDIREDLRNFKRLMEVGEIPTIEGQPRGTCFGYGSRNS